MYSMLPGVSACLRLAVLISTPFVISQTQDASESTGVDYLLKYGYMKPQDPRAGALRTEESFKTAISQFQLFAGINVTGKMDRDTVRMKNTPRCGVADNIGNGDRARRKKRYTLEGSKWPNNRLTYKITGYTNKLSETEVDREVSRAFKVWSDITPLQFSQQRSGSVDIEIYFAERYHGDENPFDGQGKTLAHANYPQFGGDTHFDNAEPWTIGTYAGVNLFQVAAHEFGHALGLSHSDVRSSLMNPFYWGYQSRFELDDDDSAAVQELYGFRQIPHRRITRPSPTIRPVVARTFGTPTRDAPEMCRNSKIDSITRTKNGSTYVFVGKYYYRLNDAGFDRGYPRVIKHDWAGIEGPLDAALTWTSGFTFIFKESQYWKFENLRPIFGYPQQISKGFEGIPNNVDAAFVWSGNGKTYFIKGSEYWRYTGYSASYGYPKPLSEWHGIPRSINAAFKWQNRRTYFFSNEDYYRFNDKLFRVDAGYPRNNSFWWFGCSGKRTSQPQSQLPTDTKGDVHEANDNADQYVGPVLDNYLDSDADNNKSTDDTNKAVAISFHFVTTFILMLIASLASS